MDKSQQYKVLIVDDMPENIDVLGSVLEKDYEVVIALDGEGAIKIAESVDQPDIILLDIMMPEMNGYEVCQKLKSNPETARIPVMFVTAMNEVKDEEYGFEVGGIIILPNPFLPQLY